MNEEKLEFKAEPTYEYHDPNGYKIRCGKYYPVYRQEYGGYRFYKMPISKRMPDGSSLSTYKTVRFSSKVKDCDVPDGVLIKVIQGIIRHYLPSLLPIGLFKKRKNKCTKKQDKNIKSRLIWQTLILTMKIYHFKKEGIKWNLYTI